MPEVGRGRARQGTADWIAQADSSRGSYIFSRAAISSRAQVLRSDGPGLTHTPPRDTPRCIAE